MKLIDDWRRQLNRLWTVRVALITAIVALAEQCLPALQGYIPPLAYAIISVAVIVLRVVQQRGT